MSSSPPVTSPANPNESLPLGHSDLGDPAAKAEPIEYPECADC